MLKNITADVVVLCKVPIQEAKNFISWIWKSLRQTQFDAEIMTHPRMVMATARDENGPLVQIPLQSVLMFDCMAAKPGIDNRTKAYAMWKIGETVEQVMKDTGNLDCFFYTNDEAEAESCAKHGWTELKGVRLMRKRLPASVLQTPQARVA
jgi:hypothetical protein